MVSENAGRTLERYEGAAVDGDKSICLDSLYTDIANQSCLIYSFRLWDDWTFEENMANLGCEVSIFNRNDLYVYPNFSFLSFKMLLNH